MPKPMETLKERVNQVDWYHEFDFGGGLRTEPRSPDLELHRRLWQFIERQLATIDFHRKNVLDIGAWDGYWSFYAERRGGRVVATDDLSQNWSDGRGIHLAKEILKSSIDIRQDVSVYDLASLGRRFDVIMCFGVYYHLLDPFAAFAQIRHCCHPESLVLIEGDVGRAGMAATSATYRLGDSSLPTFVPSFALLRALLECAYLRVQSAEWLNPWRRRWPNALLHHWKYERRLSMAFIDRGFVVCKPFGGENRMYSYRPAFGLEVYDERFRTVVSPPDLADT